MRDSIAKPKKWKDGTQAPNEVMAWQTLCRDLRSHLERVGKRQPARVLATGDVRVHIDLKRSSLTSPVDDAVEQLEVPAEIVERVEAPAVTREKRGEKQDRDDTPGPAEGGGGETAADDEHAGSRNRLRSKKRKVNLEEPAETVEKRGNKRDRADTPGSAEGGEG